MAGYLKWERCSLRTSFSAEFFLLLTSVYHFVIPTVCDQIVNCSRVFLLLHVHMAIVGTSFSLRVKGRVKCPDSVKHSDYAGFVYKHILMHVP